MVAFIVAGAIVTELLFSKGTDALWSAANGGKLVEHVDWSKWSADGPTTTTMMMMTTGERRRPRRRRRSKPDIRVSLVFYAVATRCRPNPYELIAQD